MIEEFLQAYNYVRRRARKDHRCCECHGSIKSGETYHYHSGICDGRGVSYKHCADCEQLFSEVDASFPDPYEPQATCEDLYKGLKVDGHVFNLYGARMLTEAGQRYYAEREFYRLEYPGQNS